MGALLKLVRRARAIETYSPIFEVKAGAGEDDAIAAAEAAGKIGPNTIIVRRFAHLTP
jgi:hypothetical protein